MDSSTNTSQIWMMNRSLFRLSKTCSMIYSSLPFSARSDIFWGGISLVNRHRQQAAIWNILCQMSYYLTTSMTFPLFRWWTAQTHSGSLGYFQRASYSIWRVIVGTVPPLWILPMESEWTNQRQRFRRKHTFLDDPDTTPPDSIQNSGKSLKSLRR